jgi:hypothetical protein
MDDERAADIEQVRDTRIALARQINDKPSTLLSLT